MIDCNPSAGPNKRIKGSDCRPTRRTSGCRAVPLTRTVVKTVAMADSVKLEIFYDCYGHFHDVFEDSYKYGYFKDGYDVTNEDDWRIVKDDFVKDTTGVVLLQSIGHADGA